MKYEALWFFFFPEHAYWSDPWVNFGAQWLKHAELLKDVSLRGFEFWVLLLCWKVVGLCSTRRNSWVHGDTTVHQKRARACTSLDPGHKTSWSRSIVAYARVNPQTNLSLSLTTRAASLNIRGDLSARDLWAPAKQSGTDVTNRGGLAFQTGLAN